MDITVLGRYVSGTQIGGTTIYTPGVPSLGIPGGSPKEVEYEYIKVLLHEFMHVHDFGQLKGHLEIYSEMIRGQSDVERDKTQKDFDKYGISDEGFSHALDTMIESRCPNN